MNQSGFDADIPAIASLVEPSRRALYLYVHGQASAVSRDEAAAGVGVPRHIAKFHLDKLVEAGLLEVVFRRLSGRSGPGAGRPAKLYRCTARELAITLPERRYELAAQLMARAITHARNDDVPVADALHSAARDHGRLIGDRVLRRAGKRASRTALLTAARAVLDADGYRTTVDPAGLTLANCPYRALAAEHTNVICGMNLAIMNGLLERLPHLHLAASSEPAEGRCCVRLADSHRGS